MTSFGYHPITLPEKPSPLRLLAYSEGSSLVGPEGDPEGWKVLPEIKIKGTLFNIKKVEVNCMVGLSIVIVMSWILNPDLLRSWPLQRL